MTPPPPPPTCRLSASLYASHKVALCHATCTRPYLIGYCSFGRSRADRPLFPCWRRCYSATHTTGPPGLGALNRPGPDLENAYPMNDKLWRKINIFLRFVIFFVFILHQRNSVIYTPTISTSPAATPPPGINPFTERHLAGEKSSSAAATVAAAEARRE